MTNALVKYSKPYSAQFGKFSKMSGILYLMGYEKDEIRTMKTLDPEELYGIVHTRFRELSKRHHPDVRSGDEETQKRITFAWNRFRHLLENHRPNREMYVDAMPYATVRF